MGRKLEIEIVGDASSLHRALNQSSTSTSKYGNVLSKLKYAAVGAGAAIGTGLVVGVTKSIHAAIEAQAVHARLEQAFKNAGLSAEKYAGQIEKAESAGRHLGFTDEQTQNSLGSLITSTGSYAKALREMGLAQDLARFKGVDLEQATKALTMANAGSQRAIKQLGIAVDKVTVSQDRVKAAYKDHTSEAYKNALAAAKVNDKQLTLQKTLDVVTQKVHGQAKAYSETAAGAMAEFHAQVQHIEVAIGERLLPVMTNAIIWIRTHWPEISKAVTDAWIQIKPTLVAFGELIKSVVNIIRSNWSSIGPIVRQVGAIIKAEIQTITAIIRVFTALLRGDWSGAWNAAKAAVVAYVTVIVRELQLAKTLVLAALRGILAGLEALGSAFLSAGKRLGLALVRGLLSAFVGLASAIGRAIQDAINSAISHIHVPSPGDIIRGAAHKIGGFIPGRAGGGSVRAGQSYLVGERGPEILTGASGRIIPNSSMGGGGGPIYLITPDGKALAEFVFDGMRGQAQIFRQRTGRPAFG